MSKEVKENVNFDCTDEDGGTGQDGQHGGRAESQQHGGPRQRQTHHLSLPLHQHLSITTPPSIHPSPSLLHPHPSILTGAQRHCHRPRAAQLRRSVPEDYGYFYSV